MKRLSLIVVLAAIIATAVVSSAAAFGPNDQAQPYWDGKIVMPPGVAQTFTVGRSGKLDGFTLTSPSGAPLFLQVYSVKTNGTPDLSHPLLPQNQTIALYPGNPTNVAIPAVPVKAGQTLALALGTIRSRTTADLAIGTGDRYTAGQLFRVTGAFNFLPVSGADLTFATHVSP